ncbi:MAG: mobile mystery protein A [Candidatus Dormibacteraceae bacterium]
MVKTARRARASLDARLTKLGPASRYEPPRAGWVRAIREALGMPAVELGRRLGVSGPAVTSLEKNEQSATASLATLARAAQALDCTLIYAFIPKESLNGTVQRRAEEIVRQELEHVATTMALEDQAEEFSDALMAEHIDQVIQSGRIWREP